jgi:hypothetical protein
MNTNLEIFYNIAVSILFLLTVLVALWVSGRIIRRNLVGADRSTQLFLWLVLGGFFRIPLVDLLSALGTLIAQTIPVDPSLSELSVRPDITVTIVKLLIYAFGIYFAQRVIAKHNIPFLRKLTLSSLERVFIVLGMAGLFNRLLGDLVGNFILITFLR